jgi:tetratricopeptide (TPR) repeat protein
MKLAVFLLAIVFAVFLFCGRASSQMAQQSNPQAIPPPPAGASALQLEQTADILRARKDYSQSLTYLRAAIRHDPNNAVLFNKCGIVEIQINDLPAARVDLKKALKLNPKYAEARNNMGVTYYMERNYKKAIKEYSKAIELRADLASFYANRGTAWFARKQVDLATKEYAQALQIDPEVLINSSQGGIAAQISSPEDRAEYTYVLAKLYAKHGDIDHSIEFLRKAKELRYVHMNDVYKDAEFSFVRGDPRFAGMMMEGVGK